MTFPHLLVILSALISVAGSAAYIRDTIRGTTKPNLVSWSMWAIAPLIGTGAALTAHADPWATVRIFLAGFLPLLIVLASLLNPKSYWRLTIFDLTCGVFAGIALVLWLAVDEPRLAILFAAVGDGFAALPTIVKAWHHPDTETKSTYIASLLSVLLILPSIPAWTIENSAFQIYLLIANTFLLLAVYRKQLGLGVGLKQVSTARK